MVLGCALLHPTYGNSIVLTPLQATPLLAESEGVPFGDSSISFGVGARDNFSIGQSSVMHVSTEMSSYLPSSLEIGANHAGIASIATTQISPSEISIIQNSQHKISSFQISISQNSFSQSGMIQNSSSEISPFEIDPIKTDFFQFHSTQINPTEISFPSSITLQQFLSSHNFNLQNTTIST
jgi:hypothetical protein